MAAPPKLVPLYGVTGKIEASYGAGGSLSASTDGILPDAQPKLAVTYANDGVRPAPAGTLGYQRKVAASGKVGDLPLKHAPKMPGSAYSSSVFFTAHNLMRLCGFDATGSFVGGSEKWTYLPTPGPGGYASGVMNLYARGELWPFTGVLGDFTWSFKGPEVPVFDFALKGLLGSYTDSSLPSIAYPYDGRDPIKAVSLPTFTLFSTTQLGVREATIKLGRNLVPRLDVMSSGHLGYAPARRTPTLEVLVEAPALATQDWWTAFETAPVAAWSLTVGSVQYNRMKWSGANCQLMAPPKWEDDGAVALLRLTMQLNPSSTTAVDDLQLVTD